jgi:hypothetical protein
MKRTTVGFLALSLSALLAAPAPAQGGGRGQTPPPQQGGRGQTPPPQQGGRGQTPPQEGGGGQAGTQKRVVQPDSTQAQRAPDARQAQTDEALRQLEARGAQASAEDLDRLAQALRQSLDDARGRERIQMAIAELQDRARNGRLSEADVRIVRTETYDVRFDQAFQELMKKAEARQASPEEFDQLAAILVARQKAAQGTELDLRKHQQRLEQAIQSLKAKHAAGTLTPEEARGMRVAVTRARLDGAFENLAQRGSARTATRADYARVRDLLAAEAEASGDPQTAGVAMRLQAALDQLEKRALSGEGVTREEFLALREQLIAKAREAGAGR